MTSVPAEARPAVRVRGASLAFGTRTLWSGLDLDVEPGEFLAILGPNGSGKSSLLKVLLGQQGLPEGTVEIAGRQPGGQNRRIGYIPQQRALDEGLTMRGVDLVGLGLDGHRWGTGLFGLAKRRQLVSRAIESVGAQAYAKQPVGRLSGGEQQRLRVAQSLVGDPEVLLCDEPLLSLDLAHQRAVSELIDERRRSANTAVLFVTHEINPILSYVDRMLYLVNGQFRVGKPDEVMNSETLSELYGTRIEVLKVGGQIHVAGAQSALCEDEPHHIDEQAS
ncbi:metal ABC transporter ATP-binding protein [Amycolatopsis regifaucium]|uniref:ABC transporter ATP-binding protein n=1 Tax=Amycolatopsis regifaucium TaxID=546365 RepID=A0A154MFV5_9PSEU|nr:metal ABC transporter ATP-binding protein [Amycolatopsis regifaucium]KZB83381.1 ABC transporter ATP-binding protein [Amycolatopsis regifaucium]OKA08847.1 ABC transporter ATP-binding protein [Amycolatopsis regifaucium]SFI92278.1 zinc/manganese transport system ATP-binding protein [Amycolatopsis regifaucium]